MDAAERELLQHMAAQAVEMQALRERVEALERRQRQEPRR